MTAAREKKNNHKFYVQRLEIGAGSDRKGKNRRTSLRIRIFVELHFLDRSLICMYVFIIIAAKFFFLKNLDF